jgi:hypothetical protein
LRHLLINLTGKCLFPIQALSFGPDNLIGETPCHIGNLLVFSRQKHDNSLKKELLDSGEQWAI